MKTTPFLPLLFAALVLAACGGGAGSTVAPPVDNGPNPTSKGTPKALLEEEGFASCDDFRTYFSRALAQEFFTGFTYHGGCFGCEPLAFQTDANDLAGQPAAAPEGADREVTDTNTQEAGVDEADLIETDPSGALLYVLRRFPRELLVIDTSEIGNPQILTRVQLEGSRQPRGLYLDAANDRLTVVREPGIFYLHAPAVSGASTDAAIFAPPPDFEDGTELQFFDISDPADPQLVTRFVTDGYYVDSRRVDDRIHLVTQFGFPYPQALSRDERFQRLAYEEYPRALRDGDEAEIERLEGEIRSRINAAVQATPLDELLPQQTEGNGPPETLACEAVEAPAVDTRLGLMMISSVDTDGGNLATLGTIKNAWQIYASSDNIYFLQTSGGWWFDREQRQQTAIYRYTIGDGLARPGAVGLVDGWINNRFSVNEFDGHLRVATTEGRFAGNDRQFTQHNHLTVLRALDLEQTGEVRDFVPTSIDPDRAENIRSARFLGERGFVVTFLNSDPLFAFDLSNPNNPVLRGQLEIPGFSSYIHPLGADHLLTIGREGGENGQGTGPAFQLQIFDVSDLTSPGQVATASPVLQPGDYAHSLAEYEPLAFTFLPTGAGGAAGLLSIPAQISSNDPARTLSGFIAYRIDAQASTIREYAQIDHKDQAPNGGGDRCPPQRDELPPQGCGGFAPVIYNEPLRSVIIRENQDLSLLTISDAKLRVLDASGESPADLGTLPFDE